MKRKKKQKMVDDINAWWYGKECESPEIDWNRTHEFIDCLQAKGFNIVINNGSAAFFDRNAEFKMVGFTNDKDAEGMHESVLSAIRYLVTTHSSFKTEG